MTKEERLANIVADLGGWKIKSSDSGLYLEVECGEFLLKMDLLDELIIMMSKNKIVNLIVTNHLYHSNPQKIG